MLSDSILIVSVQPSCLREVATSKPPLLSHVQTAPPFSMCSVFLVVGMTCHIQHLVWGSERGMARQLTLIVNHMVFSPVFSNWYKAGMHLGVEHAARHSVCTM
jgi:hypothetical protein